MPAHLIALEGPQQGLAFSLTEGEEWVIGRGPEGVDFLLDDPEAARKHARFSKKEEGIYCKGLSRAHPILLNGVPRSDQVLLKEGDHLQIGATLFLFSEGEIPASAPLSSSTQEEESAPPLTTAHDTIFEDAGEEASLPFLTTTPLILKVIAGPNAGAEIGVEKGRSYTLGKDSASCDIAFQDLSVSRQHARLTISADGKMELEDLGSKNGTAVNGILLTEKTAVTPQDLVAVGTTIFLIIDREAPQETIYSPMAPSQEIEPLPPLEPLSPPPEAIAEPSSPEEKEEAAAVEKRDWKRDPIPAKHLIAAAACAAIFLIAFLSFFSLFKSKGMEIPHIEPVDTIKEALAKFDAVQFSFNPASGKLFLVGHVLTAVDYAEMRYRIEEIASIASTEDTVVIDEYVWKAMNDVLSTYSAWRGVSVGSPTAGKFYVSGYLQTNDAAAQLNDYLTVNFPYLDRLENRVVVEENLTLQLQGLLAGKGFGAVTFQLSNGDLVLAGRYSDKMEQEFQGLLQEIDALNGVRKVQNFAIATTPYLAAIDLTQQFQVSGSSLFDGNGYSVVLNGKIYTLGDAIDGMKITNIESNTILLEKDGLRYKIDYAR